jgi:hypothetical protein
MHKKYKLTQEEIKIIEDEWICDKCKNSRYYLCDCGNKICTSCGYVHKGPYPCYVLMNH